MAPFVTFIDNVDDNCCDTMYSVWQFVFTENIED